MKNRFLPLILYGIIAFTTRSAAFASEIVIDDYRNGLSAGWKEKSFHGKTGYQVVRDDNRLCIRATSESSASGLYFRTQYDPQKYPTLSWEWKIDHVLSKGNALTKAGDDFAARVYVIFPSPIFWRTKVLTYIWANKIPRGNAVPSPYSSNAMLIPLESGPEHSGEWREEATNILEAYRKYFGEDPPKVGAIAIMTDTDNTGEKVTAWYGPIRILSAPVK